MRFVDEINVGSNVGEGFYRVQVLAVAIDDEGNHVQLERNTHLEITAKAVATLTADEWRRRSKVNVAEASGGG
jgi:hypothetical protein